MISLELDFPGEERFDERTNTFVTMEPYAITLTHTLSAVSEWESVYKRSFLETPPQTGEELVYYIRCMSDKPLPRDFIKRLDQSVQVKIADYLSDNATATVLWNPPSNGGPRDTMTSELIYWYMTQLGIPFECDKWNLNRLLTLIRLAAAKQNNAKPDARSSAAQRAAMNQARRARTGSRG